MLQSYSTQRSLSHKFSQCRHATCWRHVILTRRYAHGTTLSPTFLSLCRPPRLVANSILCLVLLSLSLNRSTESSSERRDHRSAQRTSTRVARQYTPATHNTGLCKNHWRTRRSSCRTGMGVKPIGLRLTSLQRDCMSCDIFT
jgi:hypothetical protein